VADNDKTINFTAARVTDLPCREGKTQDYYWDSAAPGLGLCVSKTSRSFVFQSRVNGGSFRMTIGKTAVWRLPDARNEARRLQVIADSGLDPRKVKADSIAAATTAQKEQAQAATRESVTLADAWDVYIAERKADWSIGHLNNHINLASAGGKTKKRGQGLTVAGPLAALMPVRLSELTSDSIASWMTREAETRATNTGQSFRILRAFIRWADDTPEYSGIIPAKAYSARKVRNATPKSEAKPADSIQREQLKLWFQGVRQLENPIRAAYLQALLLTGARRSELTELKWANVDFQWRKMVIGDKVDGMREIPLPPYLSDLLNSLPRENEWVFYSPTSESGHLEEPKDAHAKALKSVGLPHVTVHGLRRSFGTLAEWLEVPLGVVAQINGHKPSALAERHYRRRSIDFLRLWHDKIESWILTEAGIEWTPSN